MVRIQMPYRYTHTEHWNTHTYKQAHVPTDRHRTKGTGAQVHTRSDAYFHTAGGRCSLLGPDPPPRTSRERDHHLNPVVDTGQCRSAPTPHGRHSRDSINARLCGRTGPAVPERGGGGQTLQDSLLVVSNAAWFPAHVHFLGQMTFFFF